MTKPGIHIIPAGLEYDRVIKPLFKDFTVSKAYLLINDPRKSKKGFEEQQEAVEKFINAIRQVPIEWEDVYVDIYDFNETFKAVYRLINKEARAGNPVYINISSAPKILQVALTLAAFLNKGCGEVELFYVEPERYYEGELIGAIMSLLDSGVDERKVVDRLRELAREIEAHGMAAGESRIHEFPPFPIASISDIEYEILKLIRKQEKAEARGISSIKEMKELLDRELGYETPRSNVRYYLDNLQRIGLVSTERYKKELRIRLTRVGELFAEARIC